ncbi:Ppx/GppA phosphatase family protein [Thalassotalea profundi]|uniref:Exopolyphosphatase n=1 Tax=Thalassotalea profundi TaxID=2036687 RepID=A0ABQ3IEE6_9GAMM|nr:Ppx/GppA phosphatase family protein [Thalassotalea profundi]GHE81476.1 exopolyphosphatase [Thalassotalea profundi]
MQTNTTNSALGNDTCEYLAALDIGSNSFHFVLARNVEQHLQIVHSEKYRVQLAQGLDSKNKLDQVAIDRGIAVLANLAATTKELAPQNFRAVATYTLRQAKNAEDFLHAAKRVFPFDIEIISGHEEARLIYQGVAFNQNSNEQRLIIDIGGGSTECIIGINHKIKTLDSLNMGCVSYQKQFFPNGTINPKAFDKAIKSATHQVKSIAKRFKKTSWESTIGTSGTIKSIYSVINFNEPIPQRVSLEKILLLKKKLLNFQHIDDITIEGLKDSRRSVFCAGISILIAVMDTLNISEIDFCQYSLREGVLFEQLNDFKTVNVRQRTVNSLIERFNVDTSQALQVMQLCQNWFEQVKHSWQLEQPIYFELLMAAAKLHEVGFDINSSGYHKHGHYILSQADLAGFNQEQQTALAWLVGNQRKKITPLTTQQCYLLNRKQLNQLCALLRLAILLCQQRQNDSNFSETITVKDNMLTLSLDPNWLLDRPIVDSELSYEQHYLQTLGLTLSIQN